MQLHRVHKKPDWQDVPTTQRSNLQRVAVRTRAVITPGNLTTTVGFVLVIAGSILLAARHYWPSFLLLGVGRLCDLLDGWLADKTRTKSPLGELLDATADKLETLAATIAVFIAHIAPWWLLVSLLVPHAVISILSGIAFKRDVRLHPSRTGKISMAVTWLCLAGFVVIQALTAIALGLYAALGYLRPAQDQMG
jgi:phosphatidylglycerophosphate synthase